MKALLIPLWGVILGCMPCTDSAFNFELTAGVIRYVGSDRHEKTIEVGRRCADLWVAPDESVIASVAIDSVHVPPLKSLPWEKDPLPDRTSIYIAFRSEGFDPKLVISRSFVIDERSWSVVRRP